jgi:hypothetical protein
MRGDTACAEQGKQVLRISCTATLPCLHKDKPFGRRFHGGFATSAACNADIPECF